MKYNFVGTKEKLIKENIPYDEVNPFEETIDNVEEYDPDQGERINNPTFKEFRNILGMN